MKPPIEHCPSCMEPLPPTGDAYCSFCHESLIEPTLPCEDTTSDMYFADTEQTSTTTNRKPARTIDEIFSELLAAAVGPILFSFTLPMILRAGNSGLIGEDFFFLFLGGCFLICNWKLLVWFCRLLFEPISWATTRTSKTNHQSK